MRECGESQKVVEYLNFNSLDNFKKVSEKSSNFLQICHFVKKIYM